MKLSQSVDNLDEWIKETCKRTQLGQGDYCSNFKVFEDLGGICKGINVIAGRPSMGVHSFAASLLSFFVSEGYNVTILTCTRNAPKWGQYMIDNIRYTWSDIDQRGVMGEDCIKAYLNAVEILEFSNIEDLEQIVSSIQGEPKHILLIDDLQSIRLGVEWSNPQFARIENNRIMQRIRELDRSHITSIIVLSQLNRGCEYRCGVDGKKPQLCDLRDCNAEDYADTVILLHRPEYFHVYNDEKTGEDIRNRMYIIWAKNVNGPVGECWMSCDFNHHCVGERKSFLPI